MKTYLTRSALLALLVVVGTATHASAHETSLRSVVPAEGARIATETTTVRATYSAPVTPIDASLEAPDGSRTDLTATTAGATVVIPVSFAASGRHVVHWRVPQADGHVIGYSHSLVSAAPSFDVHARRRTAVTDIWNQVLRLLR